MNPLKLGFLASHRGTNIQAVIDACNNKTINAIPSVIISNNADAFVLERAKKENIPNYHLSAQTNPTDLDEKMLETFQKHKVDLIILAGFLKKIGPKILAAYKNHILNIHPALLPQYGGKDMYGIKVHSAVLAANEKESGVTVHLVDEEYDHGRILNQIKVPILPNDTPRDLSKRVLDQEHIIYTDTLKKIISGKIKLT
jgi:phosphoribosylglycinamide formyltransferase 1